jgi:hypothetical protein
MQRKFQRKEETNIDTMDTNNTWKHNGTKEDVGTHSKDSKVVIEGPLTILDLIAQIDKFRLLYVLIYSKCF